MKIKRIFRGLLFAWRGVATVVREEQNFRLELLVAAAVFALAAALNVRPIEGAALSLVIGLVLVLELLNSVLERMVDALKPRLHPFAAEVKNIAAGAVLLAAATSVAVALFIFLPYFVN
ncbi:diacylglycerol kinase family protein [Patescibacteria group bacterium]|nr:MAG: diacylglycerol kinase family protein [Patescibacteria group bacterium]